MLEKKVLCRPLLTRSRYDSDASQSASAFLRAGPSQSHAASKRAQAPACLQGLCQSASLLGFALAWRPPSGFLIGVHGHV